MTIPGVGPRSRVRYGAGAVRQAGDVVTALGARRVLAVTGRASFEASGAAAALPGLTERAQVRRWSDFDPNVDSRDLLHGLRLMAEYQPDVVVGIGGGSVMDMAKLLCAFDGVADIETLRERIRAGAPVTARRPGLVLAPTTSGSGSEATHFAVVYIGDAKYSVAGPVLRPDATLLDPAVTSSGSPYQRATSGIDAIAQAVESLWAVGATDRSRQWARHALGHLVPAIECYVHSADEAATRSMAIGSHLAGRAIDISKTTAAHALSYGITKRYGVSHGHAVALTLGHFVRAHAAASGADLHSGVDQATHRQVMAEVLDLWGAATGDEWRQTFADLMTRIGLDPSLSRAGATTERERRELAASVNAERLGNNPVAFRQEQLEDLVAAVD